MSLLLFTSVFSPYLVISIIQLNNADEEKFTPSDLMGFDGYILRVATYSYPEAREGLPLVGGKAIFA